MKLNDILNEVIILNEGVEDPSSLKCIFLTGGPGSGKSHIASNLFDIPPQSTVSNHGLKLINSDIEFEFFLKQRKIDFNLSRLSNEEFNKLTSEPESVRHKAKELSLKKLSLYKKSKLGLIIDGTGDVIDSIQFKKRNMELHGYDCYLIFVNTKLEIAHERNFRRDRKLPSELVTLIWKDCQRNMGHFQKIFGTNFIMVDNSKTGELDKSISRSVLNFIKRPISNPIGLRWIDTYYRKKGEIDLFLSRREHDNEFENDFDSPDFDRFRPITPRRDGKIDI
jgi:dephospho-CoA kinase